MINIVEILNIPLPFLQLGLIGGYTKPFHEVINITHDFRIAVKPNPDAAKVLYLSFFPHSLLTLM